MADHSEYGDQRRWRLPALPPGCAFGQHRCADRDAGPWLWHGGWYVALYPDCAERAATEDGPGDLSPDLLPSDRRHGWPGRDGLGDGLDLSVGLYIGSALLGFQRAACQRSEQVHRSEPVAQPGSVDRRPAVASHAAGNGDLPADYECDESWPGPEHSQHLRPLPVHYDRRSDQRLLLEGDQIAR